MSVRRCQAEVSAHEFADWMAFYSLEAEAQDTDRLPTSDELGAKLAAWAAASNAQRGRVGKVERTPR